MTHRLWNDEMDVQERAGQQRPGRPTDQKLTCEPVNPKDNTCLLPGLLPGAPHARRLE